MRCSTRRAAAGSDKAAAAKGLNVVNTDFVGRTDTLARHRRFSAVHGCGVRRARKIAARHGAARPGLRGVPGAGIKPPATPDFEEIRSRVETEFKNERASILLAPENQELSDRAKAEHDLKKAAKELGATMKTSDFVLPDGRCRTSAPCRQASVAFTMKPGEISGPITAATTAWCCRFWKQEPTEQDFAAKKDQIRDTCCRASKQEMFGLFVANLRQRMEKSGKIKINQQEMKNLTRAQGGGTKALTRVKHVAVVPRDRFRQLSWRTTPRW